MSSIKNKDRFLRFNFRLSGVLGATCSTEAQGGSEALEVLRCEEVLDADAEILATNQIPAPASADLESIYRSLCSDGFPSIVEAWLACMRCLSVRGKRGPGD